MNTATIMDIAWEGAQVAFRLIMAARTRRDAEAIVHQLRALGPAQRADVDAIERDALGRLADAETAALPKGDRVRLAPDFPGGRAAAEREYAATLERVGDADTGGVLVGGPLDGGD